MSQASDCTVWVGAGFLLAPGLAAVLAVALTAVGQLPLARRSPRRPYWHAGALAAVLAGLLAAGIGASDGIVAAAMAGAALGAWLVRRRNLTRRPRLVALLGSGMGLAAMAGGFARYLSSAVQANVERIELYAAVFIGALIFATSAIAFCKLRGALALNAAARPGHGIVNLLALLLCGWLGYGFVTEQAQPFGLTALLAMSALAAALGAHLMVGGEYSKNDHDVHAHAFAGRCHGATVMRRELLARIEWHGGEEQAWALREAAPGMVHTAASAYQQKRVSARHRRARRAMHRQR